MSRQLHDLYPQLLLEHSKRPRNRRIPAQITHHASGDNPLCGDQLDVFLRMEAGVIRDIAFDGVCCAIATASASLMTEALLNREREHALLLRSAFLGLLMNGGEAAPAELAALTSPAAVNAFKSREQCATLAWQALHSAMESAMESVNEPVSAAPDKVLAR